MEKQNDPFAQVGLGAMILFIGIIIAVSSSMYVMINQLERISQSAEETVSIATNEGHTQVVFIGGWIDDYSIYVYDNCLRYDCCLHCR